MRKLIMWNVMTLDGYFEGAKPWDLGFHDDIWGEELERFSNEQTKTIGAVLFGRKTYEGMFAYWSKEQGATAEFMSGVQKIVFSRTLTKVEWNNSRLIGKDTVEEVVRLKQQPGMDLYIFGSAELSSTLMEAGLIDEYRLALAPVVLGQGVPLFKMSASKKVLRLIDTQALKTGGVILRYSAGPDKQ